TCRSARRQNFGLRADPGRIPGPLMYATERRVARSSRSVPGCRTVCARNCRLGGKLFQRYSPAGETMNFQLIGVSHKTAPVDVREQLAIPDRKLPEALQQLLALPGV